MNVRSERLILASFAIWAGDYLFFQSLFEEKSNDDPQIDTKKSLPNVFKKVEKENFEWVKKARKLLSNDSLKKFPVLETKNIRATIWKITDFEYCMRAYLKNFDGEDEFFRRVYQIRLKMKNDHNLKKKFGGLLFFGRKNNCIVRIDEMGLTEGTLYVCERISRRKRQKVIQEFKRVLRNFDGGPVNLKPFDYP